LPVIVTSIAGLLLIAAAGWLLFLVFGPTDDPTTTAYPTGAAPEIQTPTDPQSGVAEVLTDPQSADPITMLPGRQPIDHDPAGLAPPSDATRTQSFKTSSETGVEETAFYQLTTPIEQPEAAVDYYIQAMEQQGYASPQRIEPADQNSKAINLIASHAEKPDHILAVRIGPIGRHLQATVTLRYAE
jgi:hypothetical protein